MSRCGSCPLYWDDGEKYSIKCEGDLAPEECAENLQGVIHELKERLEKGELQ